MNDKEFGCFKLLQLKYRSGTQIILPFCRIGSSQEIRSPLFNWRKFQNIEKNTGETCRTNRNPMNDEKFGCFKFPKLKYRRCDQIIQLFCRIGSHQEIRSPLFHLRKIQTIDKSTGESCTSHWNLLNDQEFDSLKFLEFKYRRADQIIQLFCRIGLHQEISSPLFNLTKFQKLGKTTGESCTTHWNLMNDKELESLKFLELKYRKGDQIVRPFYRI